MREAPPGAPDVLLVLLGDGTIIESVTFDFGDFDEPSGMDRVEMATKLD